MTEMFRPPEGWVMDRIRYRGGREVIKAKLVLSDLNNESAKSD